MASNHLKILILTSIWPQHGLNIAQLSHKTRQNAQPCLNLTPTWLQHGSSWPSQPSKNIKKPFVLLIFFCYFGKMAYRSQFDPQLEAKIGLNTPQIGAKIPKLEAKQPQELPTESQKTCPKITCFLKSMYLRNEIIEPLFFMSFRWSLDLNLPSFLQLRLC